MARPVIALVTDFGLRDHYAGTMKGVALGICPEAALVDITHDIPAHDVLAGALELDACYRYFPQGTVFVVVVDPGVGSSRRGIAAEAGGYRFVAPDNGVLSLALAHAGEHRIVELGNPRYARSTISRTFEGRDRFAPAAAWLASGVELSDLGPGLADCCGLEIPQPQAESGGIGGEVLRVDRFGNLITNIDRALVDSLGAAAFVEVGGLRIPGVVSTYADVPPLALCALVGSTDRLEIAANGSSAADMLGLGRGAAVRMRRGA